MVDKSGMLIISDLVMVAVGVLKEKVYIFVCQKKIFKDFLANMTLRKEKEKTMDNSMFDEFEEVMELVKQGDKESAMVILERKSWGENKHAMVGNIESQITLLEWGIHMLADGSKVSFEDIIKLITLKHKETEHYMYNVHKGEI